MLTIARQTAWTVVAIARTALRFALNLIRLPGVIRRAFQVILADTGYDPDPAMLRDRLLLPMAADTEAAARAQRLDEVRALVEARDWDTLLARLSAWESARRITPGRASFVTEALFTIQAMVSNAQAEIRLRTDMIDALEAAHAERPDDHLLAACLAMAHTGLGWHWRGDGFADEISPLDETRFTAHFARAAEVLAAYDAIERYSPALAVAQYQLYPCHPQAGQMIDDWFADWADLDPQSIDPYLAHGSQLLPRWFGEDAAALDRAALRAAVQSADTLGDAAYTLLYLGALDLAEPEVLRHCNADLFLAGLRDLLARTPSQHLVNRLAHRLYHGWKARKGDPAAEAALADLRRTLGRAFRTVARDHLQTGLPEIWGGEDATLWTVAQAFEADLETGALIRFGESGSEIERL